MGKVRKIILKSKVIRNVNNYAHKRHHVLSAEAMLFKELLLQNHPRPTLVFHQLADEGILA